MSKRQYYHIAVIAVLFISALIYDSIIHKDARLGLYASRISTYLQQQENEVDQFLEQKAYIKRQLGDVGSATSNELEKDNRYLEAFTQKPYTINIHQEDSLVFWTNNYVLLPEKYVAQATTTRSKQFIELQNGSYELIQQAYRDPSYGPYTVSVLIPIKYEFKLESNYLGNEFVADHQIPHSLILSQEKSDFPILTKSGQTLAYLNAEGKVVDQTRLGISLLLYLVAFVVLGFLFNHIAQGMIQKGQLWQGAAF